MPPSGHSTGQGSGLSGNVETLDSFSVVLLSNMGDSTVIIITHFLCGRRCSRPRDTSVNDIQENSCPGLAYTLDSKPPATSGCRRVLLSHSIQFTTTAAFQFIKFIRLFSDYEGDGPIFPNHQCHEWRVCAVCSWQDVTAHLFLFFPPVLDTVLENLLVLQNYYSFNRYINDIIFQD